MTYGLFASRLCARKSVIQVIRCRDGTAYADIVARRFPAESYYQNLAIGGEFTAGVRRDEVVYLGRDATLVFLNIGRNDEMPNNDGPVRFDFAVWKAEYGRLIAAIRERAPNSKLVVANLPNYAYFPAYSKRPSAWRAHVTDVTNEMNAVIDSLEADGATIVDLHCSALVYSARGLADVGHPNDLGHRWNAGIIWRAIVAPRPPAVRCPPYSERP